ncbi:MAG TPA: porin [Candidatus Limnocylindrales bacterium]|nr:porin [Candidatus Limnocylindrales bacterium]
MVNRWGLAVGAAIAFALAAPASHAQDNTFKVFWKDGVRAESGDGAFKLKLGGRIMYDAAFFDADTGLEEGLGTRAAPPSATAPLGGPALKFKDGTELRRARIELDAIIYERFLFKAQYDFVDTRANIKDMWLGVDALPYVGTLRIGQVKEPFSLDELTSSKYDEFIEQGLPTAFTPGRNPGITIQNAVLDERVQYAAGIYRNADDAGNSGGDGTWAITSRITGLPWYGAENKLLHIGANFTYRDVAGRLRFNSRPESHLAPNVVDTGNMEANWMIAAGPELAFVYGPFSLQGEFIYTHVDGETGTANPVGEQGFYGYYAYASYWLTGESRNYKTAVAEFDRVKPARNLLQSGGWGAWQALARFSSIDLDDSNGIKTVNGGKAWDFTAGLNWHWNPNMRLMFNYVYTDVEGLPADPAIPGGPERTGNAHIVQARAQVDF